MGLRSPVAGAFPEDLPGGPYAPSSGGGFPGFPGFPGVPGVPGVPESEENHVEVEEESSKESLLQDSSLTELEGKVAGAETGPGRSRVTVRKGLILYHQVSKTVSSPVFLHHKWECPRRGG